MLKTLESLTAEISGQRSHSGTLKHSGCIEENPEAKKEQGRRGVSSSQKV